MAFAVRSQPPEIEIRINFGVYTGRRATEAEIDRLARWLLDEIATVSIISEDRHEIDLELEAVVHQVRIELRSGVPTDDEARRMLEQRILERAEYWARQCVADRRVEAAEL